MAGTTANVWAAASEKPQVGRRAGHDKVPGGNRRPVPENSGAQSAFSHVGQAFAAQNQRLFEALAGDTSRPGAGAGSSHPTSLCHHCQEWTRRPARFPEHLSSSRAHRPARRPGQRCDSRPYSTCKTCTPIAPRHQATACRLYLWRGSPIKCHSPSISDDKTRRNLTQPHALRQ